MYPIVPEGKPRTTNPIIHLQTNLPPYNTTPQKQLQHSCVDPVVCELEEHIDRQRNAWRGILGDKEALWDKCLWIGVKHCKWVI